MHCFSLNAYIERQKPWSFSPFRPRQFSTQAGTVCIRECNQNIFCDSEKHHWLVALLYFRVLLVIYSVYSSVRLQKSVFKVIEPKMFCKKKVCIRFPTEKKISCQKDLALLLHLEISALGAPSFLFRESLKALSAYIKNSDRIFHMNHQDFLILLFQGKILLF